MFACISVFILNWQCFAAAQPSAEDAKDRILRANVVTADALKEVLVLGDQVMIRVKVDKRLSAQEKAQILVGVAKAALGASPGSVKRLEVLAITDAKEPGEGDITGLILEGESLRSVAAAATTFEGAVRPGVVKGDVSMIMTSGSAPVGKAAPKVVQRSAKFNNEFGGMHSRLITLKKRGVDTQTFSSELARIDEMYENNQIDGAWAALLKLERQVHEKEMGALPLKSAQGSARKKK
ncbi:MAG TPA: hypothetical protein V6D17_17225 [Candidatus Obscuribacterales bacterium]